LLQFVGSEPLLLLFALSGLLLTGQTAVPVCTQAAGFSTLPSGVLDTGNLSNWCRQAGSQRLLAAGRDGLCLLAASTSTSGSPAEGGRQQAAPPSFSFWWVKEHTDWAVIWVPT